MPGAVEQQRARGGVLDCAAAEGQDQRVGLSEASDGCVLAFAEGCLAVASEYLGDGRAPASASITSSTSMKRPAQTRGEERTDGGLAGAHEAGQDDAAGSGFELSWLDHRILSAAIVTAFSFSIWMQCSQIAIDYPSAITTAPAVINRPPAIVGTVSFSPSRSQAKTMTRGTLSLSIGATREAGPSWRARK